MRAPLAFAKQFHTKLDWDYWTEPEPHLNGRRIYSPLGKMLGGSSSMNAMIYVRGNRLDYDGWAQAGATGWSSDDVLPLFRVSPKPSQRELVAASVLARPDARADAAPKGFSRERRP